MFGGGTTLTTPHLHDLTPAQGASYALSGPCGRVDPLTMPVRGDLAHIRMAGKVFVPHYIVPMPRRVVAGGGALRQAAKGEVIATLAGGTAFAVLDISGGFAWGECGEGGAIGYISLDELETGE